jgi:ABC-type Fe3+ transport system permease subunit
MNEPRWRTALCWGAVITFLTVPLLVFILHVVSDEVPSSFHFSQHLSEYKFLTPFFQSITALVFGLAGLNSFDKHSANLRTEQKGTQ